ncbi:hypothetical protein [Mucilaginibacter sp. PAMB04168]|uniref:hypothetical protein n=1 Tax=Mucilaginibacter sp. PAMB04168 TaxID=3138567 RepID=UPI0031F67300
MLFIIIFVLSLATSYILPWWAVAIIAFAATVYAGYRPAQAFASGFGAVFCVWVLLALFKSVPNNHMLANRVAALMGLPHWMILLLATAFIGGLVGGLAALSGFYVKRAFQNDQVNLTHK